MRLLMLHVWILFIWNCKMFTWENCHAWGNWQYVGWACLQYFGNPSPVTDFLKNAILKHQLQKYVSLGDGPHLLGMLSWQLQIKCKVSWSDILNQHRNETNCATCQRWEHNTDTSLWCGKLMHNACQVQEACWSWLGDGWPGQTTQMPNGGRWSPILLHPKDRPTDYFLQLKCNAVPIPSASRELFGEGILRG